MCRCDTMWCCYRMYYYYALLRWLRLSYRYCLLSSISFHVPCIHIVMDCTLFISACSPLRSIVTLPKNVNWFGLEHEQQWFHGRFSYKTHAKSIILMNMCNKWMIIAPTTCFCLIYMYFRCQRQVMMQRNHCRLRYWKMSKLAENNSGCTRSVDAKFRSRIQNAYFFQSLKLHWTFHTFDSVLNENLKKNPKSWPQKHLCICVLNVTRNAPFHFKISTFPRGSMSLDPPPLAGRPLRSQWEWNPTLSKAGYTHEVWQITLYGLSGKDASWQL